LDSNQDTLSLFQHQLHLHHHHPMISILSNSLRSRSLLLHAR
jgi:hypothetical protein